MKQWNKCFASEVDDLARSQKRLKEVEVLLSELSCVKSSAKVYEGSLNSVCFLSNATNLKSTLKKEQGSLKKKNISGTESSDVLAF